MFAPTGTCARAVEYVYLVTHKRVAPRQGALSATPTFALGSYEDILFPAIFTSRYIMHRPGPTGLALHCFDIWW